MLPHAAKVLGKVLLTPSLSAISFLSGQACAGQCSKGGCCVLVYVCEGEPAQAHKEEERGPPGAFTRVRVSSDDKHGF